ncbi:carboxypeptidase-like regulatory domain-containing protein [Larkinella rosea]|uniref:Carboxypeptidase regulatory-like domain-containing protein n=1 Tax=Larkinella rosea TaxID=2025312 RepID=A0A3P1C4I5_9BACT|nr:carboxypeptidase-like regulatory domain-containing protein [Larkinella rosea]RRB07814.1 carboxypeptidase regulatory-like domain-containing protein [Larkinella rosea]
MKPLKHFLFALALLTTAACTKPGIDGPDSNGNSQEGIVKGRVVDEQGKPVANAVIVASSTDFYNKTSTGYTDVNGNYSFKLPTGIAEGSYTVDGTVTYKYHNKNYKMALYQEDTRVFSAYEGAVRNFKFRLTGKRTIDDDATSRPLGARLEVHHQVDHVVLENVEITLDPVGPLVDGSIGTKIVVPMADRSYYIEDIPLGMYKITARDRVSRQALGVTVLGSLKKHEPSVTSLFESERFEGSTFYELGIEVDTL